MTQTLAYRVPAMSCGHCVQAVEGRLVRVAGVERASADLDTKVVTVAGTNLDDAALRAAIAAAGYEAD